MEEEIKLSKGDYNKEPVLYCKHCLSLCIKQVDVDEKVDYCNECGSTDIGKADIESWEDMYYSKYKKKYVTKRYNNIITNL